MSKRILIVDDVAFVRKTLTEILISAGYDIAGEAADGNEAIDKYKVLRPDLVTMDVVMPRLGGIDSTRNILKMDKNAIIVMVSAMDQIHMVMEAINVGARDYIQKPFHSDEIKRVIERIFRNESAPIQATAFRTGMSG